MPVVTFDVLGVSLRLETHERLFSPFKPDTGTIAALQTVEVRPGMKVLDLGCGNGIVGIYVARFTEPQNVFLLDRDVLAVDVSRRNLELNGAVGATVVHSDGFKDFFESGFDLIICNPPYHADFAVPKEFLEKGFNRLLVGGKMVMVVKRRKWYEMKMKALFGGVKVVESNGYVVLTSIKMRHSYANSGK